MPFLEPLHKVMNRRDLTSAEAQSAMEEILRGEATTPQIAAFLAALRVKGESATEIEGFARAMMAGCIRIQHGITDEPVVDIVGTGGDGHGTINVSTIAAFVIAATGIRVAKHGNRSISSITGSADVLERLGVRLDLSPERVATAIREVGIGFLFAPSLHPAMKHAMPARRELKTRTVFNLLGPLANPACATVLVVGAPSAEHALLMAEALAKLGLAYGFVVHGEDGLDEVTVSTSTIAYEICEGSVASRILRPSDFGLETSTLDAIRGGDSAHNAERALSILGGEKGPQRDIVIANAALAIYAAHRGSRPVRPTSLQEAARLAEDAIDSGAARGKLDALVSFSSA